VSGRRTDKVSAQLQRAVQQVIIRGLSDPRARGLITVTKVEVSRDLRDATIRISVLPHEHEKLTLHALKDASKHIRREAGELMAMHRLPAFHFKLDSSLRKQAEVIEALAQNAPQNDPPPPANEGDAAPEDAPDEEGTTP